MKFNCKECGEELGWLTTNILICENMECNVDTVDTLEFQ